jgi:thymidylate synthase (FAD)
LKIEKKDAQWINRNDKNIYELIEYAGKVCYKSQDTISKDSYKPFIKRLIKSGHESVLEHGIIGIEKFGIYLKDYLKENDILLKYFYFEFNKNDYDVYGNVRAWRDLVKKLFKVDDYAGYILLNILKKEYSFLFYDLNYTIEHHEIYQKYINNYNIISEKKVNDFFKTAMVICDRSTSHQIVRHRNMGISQSSQRYCNYSKDKFENNVFFIQPEDIKEIANFNIWKQACKHSEDYYFNLLLLGCKPETARSVLNNSVKTELILTAHNTQWEHIFKLRCDEHAQIDIRVLMNKLKKGFKK